MKVIRFNRSGLGPEKSALSGYGYEYERSETDQPAIKMVLVKRDGNPVPRYYFWFVYKLKGELWTIEKNARPAPTRYIRAAAIGTTAEVEQLILHRLARGAAGKNTSKHLLEAMPLVTARLVGRELEL